MAIVLTTEPRKTTKFLVTELFVEVESLKAKRIQKRVLTAPSCRFSFGVRHQLRGQAVGSVPFIDPQELNLKVFPVSLRCQSTNDVLVIVPDEQAQRTNVILCGVTLIFAQFAG